MQCSAVLLVMHVNAYLKLFVLVLLIAIFFWFYFVQIFALNFPYLVNASALIDLIVL